MMMRPRKVGPSRASMTATAVCVLLAGVLAGCVTTTEGDIPRQSSVPERVTAQLQLARGYLDKGDVVRALGPLNKALELDPRSWQGHDLIASVYYAQGDVALAEDHYRKAVRYGGARAHNNYGAFLFTQRNYDAACRELNEAAQDPQYEARAQVFENLGVCELRREQPEAAEEAFKRSLAVDARRPRSYLELADLYFNSGRYTEANAAFAGFKNYGQQTPRSLLLGIAIGRQSDDRNAVSGYVLQLKNRFPTSPEYREFQANLE